MLSIGAFARLGSVSVRMLRHYDEIGLLRPADVDVATGYRRYDPGQLAALHRIVVLRDLGLTLEQVRGLQDDVSAEELRGMLLLRKTQIESSLEDEQARLRRVEARLGSLDSATDGIGHDIVIKHLPSQLVASVAAPAPGFGPDNLAPTVRPAFDLLRAALADLDVAATGPAFCWYDGDPQDGTLVAHPSIPVATDTPELEPPVELIELPAVDVATMVRDGAIDETYGGTYTALYLWASANGYEVIGHGRDEMIAYAMGGGERTVIRVQLPVRAVESRRDERG